MGDDDERDELVLRPGTLDDVAQDDSPTLTDRVTTLLGSWRFIGYQVGFILLWCLFNILGIAALHFDPFPYLFLNLALGVVSSLTAPIIMMSQNRQEERDYSLEERVYHADRRIVSLVRSLQRDVHDQFETIHALQAQITMMHTLAEAAEVRRKRRQQNLKHHKEPSAVIVVEALPVPKEEQ